jgi:hypothetical protein
VRQGIPVYKIVDYEDDPVQGTFYIQGFPADIYVNILINISF